MFWPDELSSVWLDSVAARAQPAGPPSQVGSVGGSQVSNEPAGLFGQTNNLSMFARSFISHEWMHSRARQPGEREVATNGRRPVGARTASARSIID